MIPDPNTTGQQCVVRMRGYFAMQYRPNWLYITMLATALSLLGCEKSPTPTPVLLPDQTPPTVVLSLEYDMGRSRFEHDFPTHHILALIWSDGLATWAEWDPASKHALTRSDIKIGRVDRETLSSLYSKMNELITVAGARDGMLLMPPDTATMRLLWHNPTSDALCDVRWAHWSDQNTNPYTKNTTIHNLDNQILELLRRTELESDPSAAEIMTARDPQRADWWAWVSG